MSTPTIGLKKRTVIFLRYSDPNKQCDDSADAQERRVRHLFDTHGIDHRDALVFSERGIRGDLEGPGRASYSRLLEMIAVGEVAVIGVDQQGRFSRGLNIGAVVQDLVYKGGRFLSGDGIDTDRKGWEDLLGLKSIHNRMELRDLAHRVRRQQEHFAADPDGCVGDYPYGYKSEYLDPKYAMDWNRRGPKPRRRTVIDRPTAAVVRLVFYLYTKRGWSISHIVRHLNSLGSRVKPIVSKRWKGWAYGHIRWMLSNKKYIGDWTFGQTTTIRDSAGKKKQVEASADQVVVNTYRPHLRLIDQATWERTVANLARNKEVYGMKSGQLQRGTRAHYTTLYPTHLFSGLIFCKSCGAPMHIVGGVSTRMQCSRHKRGLCSMSQVFYRDEAEEKVIGVLRDALVDDTGWMARTLAHMRSVILQSRTQLPELLKDKKASFDRLRRDIDNLVDFIRAGNISQAIGEKLRRLESDAEVLRGELDEVKKQEAVPPALPDEMWVQEQLKNFVGLLRTQIPVSTLTLREILGKIMVEPVLTPGKKRGYVRLHVTISTTAAIAAFLKSRVSRNMLDTACRSASIAEDRMEFSVDVGSPTRLDANALKIVEMRDAGLKWREIAAMTGIAIGNASNLYTRTKAAQVKIAEKHRNPPDGTSVPAADDLAA